MSFLNKIFGPPLEEQLRVAINDNKYELVKELIKKGANINFLSLEGRSPFFNALTCKDYRIFQLLIDSGANVNLVTNNGTSPIIISSALNDFEKVKLLINKGANIHQKDENGWTALIYASGPLYSAEDIENLNLEKLDEITGKTPSYYSRIKPFRERLLRYIHEESGYHMENDPAILIKMLLSAGANPNESNSSGHTPLMGASYNVNYKAVQTLLEAQAIVNQKDCCGYSALTHAVAGTADDLLLRLLPRKSTSNDHTSQILADISDKEAALYFIEWIVAITPKYEQYREQCVDQLIRSGADVNVTDTNGVSILMLAVTTGNSNVVTNLVVSGADINYKDSIGRSPLFVAAKCGEKDIINFLLSKGVDINIPLNDGTTPLMAAVWNGHVDTVQLLLNHGANAKCKKITNEVPTGETPLFWAEYKLKQKNGQDQQYQKIKELLKEAGA